MNDTDTERAPIEVVPGQLDLGLGESKPSATPTDTTAMVQKPKPKGKAKATTMGFNFRVADELQPLIKPITDFMPHPRNFRKHKLDAIAESLNEFGQQSPIVVQRSTGYVCKGNGTYKALIALGATQIAASVEDFDDETAFRYLVADNRASDLAEYERDKQLTELRALADGPGMQGTLMSIDDLEDLEAEFGAVQHTQLGEFKGGYADIPEAEGRKAAPKASGAKLREVPVTMSVDQHKQFIKAINVLEREWGTKGAIATIIEAVFRSAASYTGSRADEPAAGPDEDLVARAEETFGDEVAASSPEPSAEELAARV